VLLKWNVLAKGPLQVPPPKTKEPFIMALLDDQVLSISDNPNPLNPEALYLLL
jgi:hypothetical protein